MLRLGGVALLLAVIGCAADGADDDRSGGGGKADGDTCTDPMYGDGTCQLDLACGIPDIDCFQTFADDAAAGAWLTTVVPSAQVPADDPRFARARALLDRAWTTYQAEAPIGLLAESRLALVLLDDPSANAWVTSNPDLGKAVLSVQVHTGIFLDSFTDDDLLGVLFHEIAHITKLHVFPDIRDRTLRFYLADGAEPVGAYQPDQAPVRDAVTRWLELAQLVGAHSTAALDDLPLGGNLDALFSIYLQQVPFACAPAAAGVNALYARYLPSPLDDSLAIDATGTGEIDRALDVLGDCVAPHGQTMQGFIASLDAEWQAYVMSQFAADEQWLLPEDAFAVLTLLTSDRRGKLLAIERQLATKVGKPWSAVRYFSTEEQADDIAVTMSQVAKMAEPGVAGFMLDALVEFRGACEERIASGTVPYGVRLDDDHHGTCWRVAHARQLASSAGTSARQLAGPDAQPRTPFVPTRQPDGKPMY